MTTAMICGVSGQDGAYLARLLLEKGYRVVGTSRDASTPAFGNLARLGIEKKVVRTSLAPSDFRSVMTALKRFMPDEVYNLSGQSSVGLSFEQPVEAMESIATGTLTLLEAIRFSERPVRFYNAGSGECFGNAGNQPAVEETPFYPRSPYAVAKAAAHGLVANYREVYGMFACTGILFNHESPLRPERFVTRKIVSAAARIAAGNGERLSLGNIEVQRDWGAAREYVDAMWRILQQDRPDDFIIATGRTTSLRQFVASAFAFFDLKWEEHVQIDSKIFRPTDVDIVRADPGKAYRVLGWRATVSVEEVVAEMCAAERSAAASPAGGAAAIR